MSDTSDHHDQTPWMFTEDDPPGSGGRLTTREARSIPALTALAWFVIVGVVIFSVSMQLLMSSAESEDPNPDDPIGITLMQIQARYLVGASASGAASRSMMYGQAANSLNLGSVGQRQRFLAIAAELGGPDAAREHLEQLDADIETMRSRDVDPSFELTPGQQSAQDALRALYRPTGDEDDLLADNVARLDDVQRATLTDELGWFGELALHPRSIDDEAARDRVLAPAEHVARVLLIAAFVILFASIFGFLLLITVIVLLATGRMRSHLRPGRVANGIHAETFALWIVMFFGLPIVVGGIAHSAGASTSVQLWVGLGTFFASLLALVWPRVRGARASDVLHDIGLTLRPGAVIDPVIAVLAYLAGIPIVLFGLVLTFGLMLVQTAISADSDAMIFQSTARAAHPAVLAFAGGIRSAPIEVRLLVVVAAPIVEEITFRGVLYRHLREVSRGTGIVLSVVLSTAISSFIFAIIHPQGWVAVPVLGALAFAFCMAREWRDGLIAPICMHALSNGLVMGMLILVLSG